MNQSELKQILSSKFNFEVWKPILESMFLKIDYLSKPIQIDADLVKSGGQVGVIRLDDGRSLGLFKFEVADNIKIARNRKGLRDIAIKYVDQDIIHGALVFYYSESQADYRLTFVSKQTSLNDDGTFVTNATAPKRYTFLLGTNEPCTTAANRLLELINKKKNGSVYLADVTEAFSVERLNKDFFKGYKDQYFKFLGVIGENSKENRDYVKKLLGRLVFLQFLQKKGWMGVPASNTNWEGGDKNYLYNLVKKYNGNNRLLSDVLEVLFFNTLNEKRPDDIADPILGDNIKIPYLNGGLFDKDDLDKKDIDFPYSYFEELMEFFGMYNFTIDENDPDDAEVGVDPEMLGHIFENLLEDNKDKGAFYTPKEIVQYMSEESISQYLKTHTDEAIHPAIDELIKEKKVNEAIQDKTTAIAIYKLLTDVKVCDPAIGSGAFPMGVLNVLYHSRLLLYGFTKPTQGFSPSAIKREIIQNNIYGVDIEKGAIDIARLRFWLSIVVDSDMPEALPNFDYKFMQGNSLLESFDGLDMSRITGRTVGRPSNSTQLIIGFDSDLNRKNLQRMMRQYFSVTEHHDKTELRHTINGEVKSLLRNSLGGTPEQLTRLDKLDCSANSEFFLWHTWFKDIFDNGGFDVVIGNPPYVFARDAHFSSDFKKQIEKEYFSKLSKSKKSKSNQSGKINLFALFILKGIMISTKNGVLSYIVPNNILRTTTYDLIRKYILDNTTVCQIVDLGSGVFEKVTASTITLQLVNKTQTNNEVIVITDVKKLINTDATVKTIPQSQFLQNTSFAFNIFGDINSILLTRKIDENAILFGDFCKDIIEGIVAKKDLIFLESGINRFPMLEGKCIKKYSITGINKYIEWNKSQIHRTRPDYLWEQKEKLVTQRISGGIHPIVVAYDSSKFKSFASVNNIVLKEEFKHLYKYFLALLNSNVLNWYYANNFSNNSELTVNISKTYLEKLPIPKALPKQCIIISLVDKVLAAKKKDPQANTSTLENEIDKLVYELYGLTYDEVLIVDPETPISKEEY